MSNNTPIVLSPDVKDAVNRVLSNIALAQKHLAQIKIPDEVIVTLREIAQIICMLQKVFLTTLNELQNNQNIQSELNKVGQYIQQFSESFSRISEENSLKSLLCDTAKDFSKVNVEAFKEEIKSPEKKKCKYPFEVVAAIMSLILACYSIIDAQNNASKQDLLPVIKMQSQILEGMQKIEQINSVLQEQNKELHLKLDRLEQNQKMYTKTAHTDVQDKSEKN